MLRQTYGLDVFATMVPVAVDYKEAIAQRRPVAQYKPKGAAAKMIKALAEEIMGRIVACPHGPRGGRLMGKLDKIIGAMGGNIAESMGGSPRRSGRFRPTHGPSHHLLPTGRARCGAAAR